MALCSLELDVIKSFNILWISRLFDGDMIFFSLSQSAAEALTHTGEQFLLGLFKV